MGPFWSAKDPHRVDIYVYVIGISWAKIWAEAQKGKDTEC